MDNHKIRSAPRLLLLTLALAGAGLAARDFRSSQAAGVEVATLLGASGIAERHPGLAGRLKSEPCRFTARLLLSRALVADSQDARWTAGLEDEELRYETGRILERLKLAESLAMEAYSHLPAAWQAPLLVGASRFFTLWRTDSRVLLSRTEEWLQPLQTALELAPRRAESKRMLATGYLTVWYGISEALRHEARELLRVAMEDRGTFDRLLPAWLRAAASREEAFSYLPDSSYTWRRIAGLASEQRDWELFGDTRKKYRESLHRELLGQLEIARRRLRGGDVGGGRSALLKLLSATPTEMAFVEIFRQGFEALPPGPVGPSWSSPMGRWREWILELALLRESPVSSNLVRRLGGVTGPPPAEVAALTSVLGNDLPAAERFERRADSVFSEAWAPYLIVKARELLRRGDVEGARLALRRVHLNFQSSLAFLMAARELEPAGAQGRADLARDNWAPTEWRWRDGSPRLALWPSESTEILVVEIAQAPPEGAVVDIHLDGYYISTHPVYPQSHVEIALPQTEPPHLLVLQEVAGGKVVPGAVTSP